GCVIFHHIENKALFYRLPHSIETERLVPAIFTLRAKEFECFGLGCSGEREVGDVGQPTALLHFFSDAVFKVFTLSTFLYVCFVKASYRQYYLQAFGTLAAL